MEANCIRGILPLDDLHPMVGGHSGLLGITSLKGQVVSVMDLRARLQLPHASQGSQPNIVILALTIGSSPHLLGFVADRIADVLAYRDRDLRHCALRGKGRPRKLVDFHQLVTEDEWAGLCVGSP